MNPRVNLWATLTGLATIVSVVAVSPAEAEIPFTNSVEAEDIGQRIARVREVIAQRSIGQVMSGQNVVRVQHC